MRTLNIPINLASAAHAVPRTVPVNYEFGFCEQMPESIVPELLKLVNDNPSHDIHKLINTLKSKYRAQRLKKQ